MNFIEAILKEHGITPIKNHSFVDIDNTKQSVVENEDLAFLINEFGGDVPEDDPVDIIYQEIKARYKP